MKVTPNKTLEIIEQKYLDNVYNLYIHSVLCCILPSLWRPILESPSFKDFVLPGIAQFVITPAFFIHRQNSRLLQHVVQIHDERSIGNLRFVFHHCSGLW